MKVKINFDTGNAAFADNPEEYAYIFRQVQEACAHGVDRRRLLDSNGNVVGSVEIAAEDKPARGCCPVCKSTELVYVQKVLEYHHFKLDMFPGEFVDLLSLDYSDNEVDNYGPRIVCRGCAREFTLTGKEIGDED